MWLYERHLWYYKITWTFHLGQWSVEYSHLVSTLSLAHFTYFVTSLSNDAFFSLTYNFVSISCSAFIILLVKLKLKPWRKIYFCSTLFFLVLHLPFSYTSVIHCEGRSNVSDLSVFLNSKTIQVCHDFFSIDYFSSLTLPKPCFRPGGRGPAYHSLNFVVSWLCWVHANNYSSVEPAKHIPFKLMPMHC